MNENKEYYQNDEIDVVEVFLTLWNKKFLIITITSIAAILSVLYALSLPNIYTSKASLVPSAPEDSLQSRIGALSSFGAFAGIDMPASKASKSQEAIERIQSFEFFSTYFLPNIKLENIMAVEKWLGEENLVYDKSLFDKKNNVWTKDNKGISNIPSEQEAYKVYRSILAINDDIKTSFVTISIDHKSPIIAN